MDLGWGIDNDRFPVDGQTDSMLWNDERCVWIETDSSFCHERCCVALKWMAFALVCIVKLCCHFYDMIKHRK